MVPIGTLADVQQIGGPLIITRYNTYPAAAINGVAGPGVSSRQAIDLIEQLADRELSEAMHYEWTELAYLELQAGNTAMWLFFAGRGGGVPGAGRPIRKLVAAAGRDPGGAHVPLATRRFGRARSTKLDINIFTQIGFVVLVGLASKNAILIVEFAKRQREAGATRRARRPWKPASCGCGRS